MTTYQVLLYKKYGSVTILTPKLVSIDDALKVYDSLSPESSEQIIELVKQIDGKPIPFKTGEVPGYIFMVPFALFEGEYCTISKYFIS